MDDVRAAGGAARTIGWVRRRGRWWRRQHKAHLCRGVERLRSAIAPARPSEGLYCAWASPTSGGRSWPPGHEQLECGECLRRQCSCLRLRWLLLLLFLQAFLRVMMSSANGSIEEAAACLGGRTARRRRRRRGRRAGPKVVTGRPEVIRLWARRLRWLYGGSSDKGGKAVGGY